MGASHYIVIRKEGREYKGYMQFAGCKEKFKAPYFVRTSLIAAIKKAQSENTQYGYEIRGL